MQQSISEILMIKFQFPYPNKTHYLGHNGLLPLLQLLDSAGFPSAIRVEFTGKKSRTRKMQVNGYLDPQLTAILEPVGSIGSYIEIFDNIRLWDGSHGSRVAIYQGKNIHFLSILIPIELLTEWTTQKVQSLFQKLVQLFPGASVGQCSFLRYLADFNLKYSPRHCCLPFLVWLQYLSAKELEIQGGKTAFETNSLLQTKRIHDGLLIEVGESPYDIFTDEGEALLAKATESLPPVVESAKK